MTEKLKIFVGYDSREDIAYQVCRHSLLSTDKKNNLEIIPLRLDTLIEEGHYTRDVDKLASTEFTFSRFLIPHLMDYEGWALFCDCDFLFLKNAKMIFDKMDPNKAVMCVKHDYTPAEGIKMDGQKQTVYPRKNWSSLVLWNCGHPANRKLTKELVNDPETTGQFLHRFSWLEDRHIGDINHHWNWLVGWYKEPQDGTPNALHYTEGGPWFKEYQKCEYAVDWLLAEKSYLANLRKQAKSKEPKYHQFEGYHSEKEELIQDLLNYSIDPDNNYLDTSWESIKERAEKMGQRNAAIDSSGPDGVDYQARGHKYDPILTEFIHGCGGVASDWDKEQHTDRPLVIRGLGGSSRKALNHCLETGRTFYAIDTGYFGNGKIKKWHRVTENALQNYGPILERPTDRARSLGYKFRKFKGEGRKILVAPPSEKVMRFFGQLSPEEWVEKTVKELKQYTDRPIEIRLKPIRAERWQVGTNSMADALADDVFCLVTYNSIAALEALMEGKPAVVLGRNAAEVIAETDIKNVDNPRIPTKDEMDALMAHLAYCQFTIPEMRSGYAWRILNESHQLPKWHPEGKQ